MSFSRFVWLVGGATGVVVASAAGLAACSSSSSNPGTVDSGTSTMGDTGTSSDTGEAVDSGTAADTSMAGDTGGSSGDSGGSCETPPSLFAETTPGVYCPFSGVDGGDNITCAAGQHCCETPTGSSSPSTCVAMGTACPVTGSIDWQCEEAVDCTVSGAAGPICCGNGSPMPVTSCGNTWTEWTGFTGTTCATSCPNPGFVVCEKNADCTGDAGTTCSASKSNGNDFGYCTP